MPETAVKEMLGGDHDDRRAENDAKAKDLAARRSAAETNAAIARLEEEIGSLRRQNDALTYQNERLLKHNAELSSGKASVLEFTPDEREAYIKRHGREKYNADATAAAHEKARLKILETKRRNGRRV